MERNLKAVIYTRVSTQKQSTVSQTLELRDVCKRNNWMIVREIDDQGISGAKGRSERPGFDELHRIVSRREADIVVVWSVDRLGRSLTDLLSFMAELEAKGMNFYSHQQGLDSRTPGGRLSFAIFSAVASFEREIIKERVCAGLARARAEGKKLGRPSNVNSNTSVAVKLLREKGHSIHSIAKQLRIGVGTTQRILAAA